MEGATGPAGRRLVRPNARSTSPRGVSIGLVGILVATLFLAAFLFFAPRAAAESWTQSSQADFLTGDLANVVATPGGTLQLVANGSVFGKAGIVVPHGPPGSYDSVYARMPFVLRDDDGTYKMWYSGLDGSRNRMLYATSLDGISWTKHGVIMDVLVPPYYWDSVAGQSVLKINSTYHMWFSAGYWSGGPFTYWAQIYHATSSDGVRWAVSGVALPPNQSWDIGLVGAPWVVQDGLGLFWLFVGGWDGSNTRVGVATSENGTSFIPYARNPIIDLGPPGSWDAHDTNTPAVIPGSRWAIFFAGKEGVTGSIGIATSDDGFNWTKLPFNPVIMPDPAPAFDSEVVYAPDPIEDPTGPRLYYAGSDGSTMQIGLMMNVSAFAPVGTYTSRVFDSGSRLTTWQSIQVDAQIPPGALLAVAIRIGDSGRPDDTWSDWQPVDGLGAPADVLRGRFAQYQLALLSFDRLHTPTVDAVTVSYAPDQPPVASALAPAGEGWVDTASLRWTALDPEGDPQAAFEVQLSRDASFATIDVTSGPTESGAGAWEPSGLADGTWYWRVRLSDGVGWGPWAVASFRLDTTPPALSVLSPHDGAVVPTNRLEFQWMASDLASGLDRIELGLDDTYVEVDPTMSSYVFGPTPDGLHDIEIRAFDRLGHRTVQEATVTVDTAKPRITITNPAADGLLSSNRVGVRWEANGTGSEIARYQVRLDNGQPIEVSGDESGYVFVSVSDGEHVVEVTAFDQAGHAATASRLFRVDANLFSMAGPYGVWPDALLIVAVIAAAAFFVVRRVRRRKVRPGPPPET